jgi:sugar phosphate isomerase/epimerase
MHGADRFVINTRAFAKDWTVEACLAHLNAHGFHHFELTPAPGFLWPGDMDKAGCAHFQRFLAGHRLRIVALDTTRLDLEIAAPDDGLRGASLEALERIIELGGDIGAQAIVLGLGQAGQSHQAPSDELQGHLVRALDRLAKITERAGTGLWIENPPLTPAASAPALMQLLDRHGDARIGIVYDVASGWTSGEDLGSALRGVAGRLRLVRVPGHELRLPGRGPLPINTLPPILAEIGYADWPVLAIPDAGSDAALESCVSGLLAAGFGQAPPVMAV